MAKKKAAKKGKRIRFELSLKGLFGLGVVLFCIFLWMFLLGIWAGQTVFFPEAEKNDISSLSRASALIKKETGRLERTFSEVREKVLARKLWNKSSANSVFSIQIASTEEKEKAERLVMDWQARGYDAFYRPPEDDFAYRVFIGRFEEFVRAKSLADTMESSENVRAYITLLAGG